jgi:UDP-N-acetylglucosamine 2-epimerase (non-hydrolysing)
MKILIVAGARPNFIKIAPIIRELSKPENKIFFNYKLVHTGQHYDYSLSESFFKALNIPDPDYYLNVGSCSHAVQTAKIMVEFEKVCIEEKPEMVLVFGDVNSTIACALTAKKMNILVSHIESGLRSGDLTMPEEINRIATDSISDFYFTTEQSANQNLMNEGVDREKIFFTGNVMIDSLIFNKDEIDRHSEIQSQKKYGVITLHRPSNVDSIPKFISLIKTFNQISKSIKLFFPVHPRTKMIIENEKLESIFSSNIDLIDPMGYIEFVSLCKNAEVVFTDSGGVQEESTYYGVPCITLRDNTERPITIEVGTNFLVGTEHGKIIKCWKSLTKKINHIIPELWDGNTAKRIVNVIKNLDLNN